MEALREIHLVVAFLAAFCALIFSWNAMGRRVVNGVVALQTLLGIALAGMAGAQHIPLPPSVFVHLLVALLALAAYGFAMRLGKRPNGAKPALALSVAGLVLVFLNLYLGWHMVGRV